uniref:Cell cycle and ribosome biogenesis protein n=1 Tax=Lotharella vacuolata TaxID=74820 RepID=A0A0H5BHE0_9EUKA|nr:cell cycle and ribosome biogenesis protein [Lotharella vacuolata]
MIIMMMLRTEMWNIIKNTQCVFRNIKKNNKFCYSKINVSFLCKKFSCPLINQNYISLIETDGSVYLWIRNSDKNDANSYLWDKYKLSDNYLIAKEQLDIMLYKWPSYFFYFLKVRLQRIFHHLIKLQIIKKNKFYNKYTLIKKELRNVSKISQYLINKFDIHRTIVKELKFRLNIGLYNEIYFKHKNKSKIMKHSCNKNFLKTIIV